MKTEIIQYEYEQSNDNRFCVWYTEGPSYNPIVHYENVGTKKIDIVRMSNFTHKPYVISNCKDPIEPIKIEVQKNNYDLYHITDDRDENVPYSIINNKYRKTYTYYSKDQDVVMLSIDTTKMDTFNHGVYIHKSYSNHTVQESLICIDHDILYNDHIKTCNYHVLPHMYNNLEILEYKDFIYNRNKYGFVYNIENDNMYNYKSSINPTDYNMDIYSIYRVPMIYGIQGLYITDSDHWFVISDEATINVKANRVSSFMRHVYYMTSEEYIKELE